MNVKWMVYKGKDPRVETTRTYIGWAEDWPTVKDYILQDMEAWGVNEVLVTKEYVHAMILDSMGVTRFALPLPRSYAGRVPTEGR